LRAAAHLIRDQGYAMTTLRQIGDAAGIKAGSIYYHFASKDDLLVEVLDTGMKMVTDAVRTRLEALPPNASSRDKIAAGIKGHLDGLLVHGDFTSANTRAYNQLTDAIKKRHRSARRAYADYWDTLLEEAMNKGDVRSDIPVRMLRMFLLGALNWTVEWYDREFGTVEQFAERMCMIAFSGILMTGKPLRRKGG
jgi:AcrR family transcriptional regulator